ncbi:hypothetical protein [Deinococcus wulumuqiensis]|uniref:hypothetical protein n=1 Tax=Deinococcus wulumuqiensis TaxID=980427 RepID=UPI0024306872|nr:hypothetical protein [Deinococcus wulumuqiensis]
MEDLRLTGSADFTDLFAKLDQYEKTLTRLDKLELSIRSPKLDLSSQLKQVTELEARLKALGGAAPVSVPRTQSPASAPAPKGQPTPTLPQEEVDRAEVLRKRLTEIHNVAAILRNDFIAAGDATNIADEEIKQLQGRVSSLKAELSELRPIAEQTFGSASKEVKQLSLTTAQLQRTITGARGEMSRLGIASQFKTALDSTTLFQNPQQNVNGAVQLVRGYEQARLASNSFQKTLQRQNIEVAGAQDWVQKYADRFNTVPAAVQQTIKVLLNNGYTMKQAQETMELYAASSLVAAKDVNGAVDALASDVQMGSTIMSNQYGITANQATAWQQYAKSIGVAVEALTAEQKAQGFLIALRREATNDLREADTILEGVGGTLGETSAEFRKAQQELGEALLPAVTNGAKQLTNFLREFNKLDPAVKDGISNVVVWGTAVAGAGLVLRPLIGLLQGGVGLFKKIGELAGKGGAAKGLGELAEAGAGAAGKSGAAAKGLRELSEIGEQAGKKGFFSKLGEQAKAAVPALRSGINVMGQWVRSLAASPATKGGLYGAAAALGYGVGTLIAKIKTLNGLTIGERVQNVSLKAFSGYSAEQVNQLRIDEARNAAFNRVLREQAEALKAARGEKDKDLRASKLRTLNLERDLAVEQAALQRAQGLGDKGAVLKVQDRIKVLTQALGMERQNRAAIDANLLAEQKRKDLEEKRRPVLEGLRKIQAELAGKSESIRIEAKSDFAKDISEIARDFREQRKKLESQLKNEKDVVIRAEIQKTLDKVDRVEEASLSARTAEEIRSGRDEIAAAQRTVEEARVAAMADGAAKRRAELENELKAIRVEYGPKIKEALENAQVVTGPDRAAFLKQAGELQQLQRAAGEAARAQASHDLETIRQEEEKKQQERVRSAEEAEGRVLAARAATAEAMVSTLESQRNREVELYGQDAASKLRVERRLAPALIAARVEAVRLQAQAEYGELQRNYSRQMDEARDAGDQRGRLEAAIRAEFLEKSRQLERGTAEKVKEAQLSVLDQVRDARLRVQQEVLDRELKNLATATGAELASLQLRLEARRRAAMDRGDYATAGQLTEALKKTSDINLDRVREFKRLVSDTAKDASDLRRRMLEAQPKSELEKAKSEAGSPFSGVIREAEARLEALRKAYNKIAIPTAAQTDAFRRREQQLTGLITTATAQRTQAQAGAEAKYWQAREDKAEETHLKLSKRELDLGRLTMDGYAQVLDADRAYWETRLAYAVKGSEDEQTAQDKLRENEDERLRLQGERRAYAKDSAAFSREELQTALELATNEKDRSAALERLNAADQRRLGDLDREIASLTQQGGHEKDILALKRERAGVQKEMTLRQREELDHARALTESVLARVDAENKLALRRARTDAGVLAAQLGSLANLQNQLGALDTNLGNARSDEERNRLLAERSNLLGQIEDQEMAIAQLPLDIERQKAEVLKSQMQLRLQQLGLQDDELSVAQAAVAEAESTLTLARQQLDLMREKGTPEQQRAAEIAYNQAQVGLLTAQNALQDAPIKAQERRLGLYRQLAQAQLVLNGLQDDEVMSARLTLDLAQRDLLLAQEKVASAKTAAEREAAAAGLRTAQAAVRSAQQGVEEAPLRARERLLGLYRDQQAAQLILNRLQDDEVASANSALDVAQRELGIAQDRYDQAVKTGTLAQQQAAQAALDKARASVATARQQVSEAPVRAEERRLALTGQVMQARLVLAGLDDDEVASARAALSAAEGQLTLAQHRVDVAGTAVEREKAAADLVTAQADAEKARAAVRQAGVAQLERQLGVVRQLAQAQLILQGLNDDELAQARQAVSFAEQDLALAQQRLAVARTPVEREKAGADVAGAQAALFQAQQQQRLAPIAQQERLLGLFRQQADERLTLANLDDDAVAKGMQALLLAQEETRLAQARVDAGGTLVQVEQAQGELAAKRTAELQAQRSLIRAQLADLDASRDRVRSQVQAQAELSGLTRDSVAARALDLELTRLDRQETERRLSHARELMLTDTEVADLQVKRTQQLAQEAKARQEVNKATLEQQRLQLDVAEATARSQLARSRFFDDAVAQGRIGLAVTREQLRLLDEQIAQADDLGLTTAEQLGLQKERQGLLAQEADGVRQLAQAERDRLVFVRSLRDALDGLRGAAQDQSEATAILRASDAAALALNRLRETQADAAEFLSRGDGPFAYHEAAQGKERVEALTSAIGDYRSKLAAVADAQEQRITSMEGMIDAVRRLNDLSNSPAASVFTAEVLERQRQQALAETSRVLNDQRATYGQIASAVGRLAQAEGDRIAVQQKQLAGLADRVKGSDRGAITELRQQLSDLGLSWQEVNTTIGKVQKEGSSALGSVTARLSQEAEARLDELRGRALDALNDIGQLRAEAFKNRLESAKAFEEYARLSSAVKLADAGFSELEANQIATLNRQEALKNLIAQTSALDPSFISRKVAREAVEAENRALIEQVRLRRGLKDDRAVTRADLEQQRAISAQWVQQSALQRSAAEAALVPYSQRVELSKQTAEALKDEEAQLARMVAKREGGDFTKVSRAKIEQQRRLLEQEIIAQERTRRILGENDKQDYDPNSPEVKAAIALDLAIEDARYGSKRMARALNFEKEKARQVAEIYAAAIAAAIQKALASTRVDSAAKGLGETAGAALQQEMASVARPRPQPTPVSSTEQNRALAAALRVTVEAPRPPVMAAAPQINNNQKTVTVIYNVGGISVPVHTVEKVDSGKVAYEVLDHIQRLNDLTGIVRCD